MRDVRQENIVLLLLQFGPLLLLLVLRVRPRWMVHFLRRPLDDATRNRRRKRRDEKSCERREAGGRRREKVETTEDEKEERKLKKKVLGNKT